MKTLKDVVREVEPKEVWDEYEGGVAKCPWEYEYLRKYLSTQELEEPKCPSQDGVGFLDCKKCWDRKIEGRENQMKLKLTGIKEGIEFKFKNNDTTYRLFEGDLMEKRIDGSWIYSTDSIVSITNFKIEKVLNLNDTELAILKGRQAEGCDTIYRNGYDEVCFARENDYYCVCANKSLFKFVTEEPIAIKELLQN